MKDIVISMFTKLLGISSASGLIYSDGLIRLISDESNYLYTYQLFNDEPSKILLKDGTITEQIKKSEKLDLEAIVEVGNSIYVFGSGATTNREIGFSIDKNSKAITTIYLHDLYSAMRDLAGIAPEDFNIEGAAHNGSDWLFLNRGNGPNQRNVIFTLQGNYLKSNYKLSFNDFELPSIDEKPTGFSDATIVGKTIFFIATAEEGNSTYHDGKVGGSLLGSIDLNTMQLEYTTLIAKDKKFEGITVFKQDRNNEVTFLLCEDNDDSLPEVNIYKIDLKFNFDIK